MAEIVEYSSIDDMRCAVEWLTERIRRKSGNYTLNFPADWMPATGLSAFGEDGSLLAVATLYLEKSSPVAVCGWCVSNPANDVKTSYRAVNMLLEEMPEYARNKGAKYLLTPKS